MYLTTLMFWDVPDKDVPFLTLQSCSEVGTGWSYLPLGLAGVIAFPQIIFKRVGTVTFKLFSTRMRAGSDSDPQESLPAHDKTDHSGLGSGKPAKDA